MRIAFVFARMGFALSLVLLASTVQALNYSVLEGHEEEERAPRQKFLPYAFYNDTTEFAVASAYVASGYFQRQLVVVGNAFSSSNGSNNLFVFMKDLQVHNRLFMDQMLMMADYGLIRSYQDGNPRFAGQRSGSHDSDEDNYIDTEGRDRFLRSTFRYVLPIGDGAGDPIHTFVVDKKGLLVAGSEAGGRVWNPFASGRTLTELEFFYRRQNLDSDEGGASELETSGARFALEYDNADYYQNPTTGSRQRIAVSRDFGTLSNSVPWTSVEFEASKYFSLGATAEADQRVLAFNMWWIDAPTWDSSSTVNGKQEYHRPPLFIGATLGGLDRLKGYRTNRFHDRSAVNYAVEYRHMPRNNVFQKIPLLNKLYMPWWQWVLSAEAGRVNDEWQLSELHSDMNWNFGAGVRVAVEGIVVRADLAVGEEDAQVQMFIGQTF